MIYIMLIEVTQAPIQIVRSFSYLFMFRRSQNEAICNIFDQLIISTFEYQPGISINWTLNIIAHVVDLTTTPELIYTHQSVAIIRYSYCNSKNFLSLNGTTISCRHNTEHAESLLFAITQNMLKVP